MCSATLNKTCTGTLALGASFRSVMLYGMFNQWDSHKFLDAFRFLFRALTKDPVFVRCIPYN